MAGTGFSWIVVSRSRWRRAFGGLVGGGIGGGDGFFDDGVEVVEGFDGFGIVFDLVVESFEGEVGRVFGDEVEAFGGEGGLVDAGPGVGETGEVGGIGVFALGGFAEGIKQERIHEVLRAGVGLGRGVGFAEGGGEFVGGSDDEEAAFAVAFVLFLAPLLEVGVIPAGEGDAEAADEFFLVGIGAGPGEGIGVAGFQVERGDIAVGFLFKEPVADLFVLPAVVEFAVEFLAEVLGEEGETAARFARGKILSGGIRLRQDFGATRGFWGGGGHHGLGFSD